MHVENQFIKAESKIDKHSMQEQTSQNISIVVSFLNKTNCC